jgi:hypothetical protein
MRRDGEGAKVSELCWRRRQVLWPSDIAKTNAFSQDEMGVPLEDLGL